jgi:hypothetical protein
MHTTHPDSLRQLVEEHQRALRDEAAGARLVRHRRVGGVGLRAMRAPTTMTSRVIAFARSLRQSAWRTNPATRGGTR